MSKREKTVPERRAVGRPPIDDALEIVLYVELGLERTGLTLRKFCERRSTKYWGRMIHVLRPRSKHIYRSERLEPLTGEALRRRYGKAIRALDLSPRPRVSRRSAKKKRIETNSARLIINTMVAGLLAA